MKKIIWGVLGFGALLSSGLAFSEGDAEAGATKTIVCSACHGSEGVSSSGANPNLAGQGEKYLLKQMQDVQSGAREIVSMTGLLDAMSEQDLKDIAAYYASQNKSVTGGELKADDTYGLSAEEFLALGENLYRGGNLDTGVPACSGCHSPSGVGNAPAGFPVIGGQHGEYIYRQLSLFRDNLRINDGESRIMRGVADAMTDLEMRALANFIAGLH